LKSSTKETNWSKLVSNLKKRHRQNFGFYECFTRIPYSINLDKGPLENLMQDTEFSFDYQNQFKLMHRNTIRLLRLVNQYLILEAKNGKEGL